MKFKDQQFGPWIRVTQFNPSRKSVVEVAGFGDDYFQGTQYYLGVNSGKNSLARLTVVKNVMKSGCDTSMLGLPGSSPVTIASNVERFDVPIAEVTEISNRSMSVTEFEETLKEIDRSLSVDSGTLLPDGKKSRGYGF